MTGTAAASTLEHVDGRAAGADAPTNTFMEVVALIFPVWVTIVSLLLIRSAQD